MDRFAVTFVRGAVQVRIDNDEWCPARGVVVVVNVRGTRGDHLVLMSSLLASVFCSCSTRITIGAVSCCRCIDTYRCPGRPLRVLICIPRYCRCACALRAGCVFVLKSALLAARGASR